MDRMSIALVGLGDIAQKAYLPIVTQHEKITPVFCTRNQHVLSQLQARYRVADGFNDYTQLLASHPDAVMIHSHTNAHFEMAKLALEQGIATFVDKPLAATLEQVEQLITLATERDAPLFLGFNRRFAPKLQEATSSPIRHLRWQKNRHNLSASARTFVFDDFIHVIDGLCHYAGVTHFEQLTNWQVFAQKTPQGEIIAVHVQFCYQGALFQGSMDRHNGKTEEVIEVTGSHQKWRIDALTECVVMQNGVQSSQDFDDWQPTLYKRGFNDMLEAWLRAIESNKADVAQLQQTLLTHQLCEKVVEAIS